MASVSLQRLGEHVDHPTYSFKIVVVGESGCGKTSLINRALSNTFIDAYNPTLAGDFGSLYYKLGEDTVHLMLWDTCGQERFRSLTAGYFSKANGALLVHDVTSLRTFAALPFWLESIRSNVPEVPVFLISSKMDMLNDAVSLEEIDAYVRSQHLTASCRVSSKTGSGVESMLETMITALVQNKAKEAPSGIFIPRVSKKKSSKPCAC